MSDQTPLPPLADPSVEKLKIVRGTIVDSLLLITVGVLAYTKVIGGDVVAILIATLAGAGAVYKGQAGTSRKLTSGGSGGSGGVVLALLVGVGGLLGFHRGDS